MGLAVPGRHNKYQWFCLWQLLSGGDQLYAVSLQVMLPYELFIPSQWPNVGDYAVHVSSTQCRCTSGRTTPSIDICNGALVPNSSDHAVLGLYALSAVSSIQRSLLSHPTRCRHDLMLQQGHFCLHPESSLSCM